MKIAHVGTFDVDNFGDLLFPLVAAHRLARYGIETVPFSPTEARGVWSDSPASRGIDEFLANPSPYNGVLVGGGNILHAGFTSVAPYGTDKGFKSLLGYAALWYGTAVAARRHGLHYAWNGVGVSESVLPSLKPFFSHALQCADYLSVRDEGSRQKVVEAVPDAEVQIVPDTAIEISKVFPTEKLPTGFRAKYSIPERYAAFHVKSRYLDLPLKQVIRIIEGFCSLHSIVPVFVPIGPCHGDVELLAEMKAVVKSPGWVFTAPGTLQEILAILAGASFYVGSSLHGLVASAAYGVPGLCVAAAGEQKFGGFVDALPGLAKPVESWLALEGRVEGFEASRRAVIRKSRDDLAPTLDTHWDRVAERLSRAKNPIDDATAPSFESLSPSLGIDAFAACLPLALPKAEEMLMRWQKMRSDNAKMRAQIIKLKARVAALEGPLR